MKKAMLLCAVLLSLLFTSCDYGFYFLNAGGSTPDERASSITEMTGDQLPSVGTDSTYSFVIITDQHFGSDRERNDQGFLDWFDSQLACEDPTLRPRFLVNMGDTMNDGYASEAAEYTQFCEEVKKRAAARGFSDYKLYGILGNHDMYNDGWDVWKETVYPYTSYYRLSLTADQSTKGFSYYFLDSGNGTLGVKQLENLEKIMPKDDRPKIIICHYPIYADSVFYFILQDPMERARLLTLFTNTNVRFYFCGHMHKGSGYSFKTFEELVVKSMVTFSNCCLVTVDEKTASVSYKQISLK